MKAAPARKSALARKAAPAKKSAPGAVAARRADYGAPIDGFFAKQAPHLRVILEELRKLSWNRARPRRDRVAQVGNAELRHRARHGMRALPGSSRT